MLVNSNTIMKILILHKDRICANIAQCNTDDENLAYLSGEKEGIDFAINTLLEFQNRDLGTYR